MGLVCMRKFLETFCLQKIAKFTFWLIVGFFGAISSIKDAFFNKNISTNGSQTFEVSLISCHDGDTCKVKSKDKVITIRLAGIDALEIGQEPLKWSQASRLKLIDFFNKHTTCHAKFLGEDAFKRQITELYCQNKFVNKILVEEGLAFGYHHLNFRNRNESWVIKAESKARKMQIGIFSEKKRVQSPQAFRLGKLKKAKP